MAIANRAESSDDVVSETGLKRMTGEFDLESIFYLDLADRGLTDHRLGALPLCSSLCILHLQLNSLTSTAPLQTLTQLEELDLSVNRISSLEGCHKLVSLRKLCLAGNLIQDLDTMLVLSQLTHLRDLSLQLRDSELTNPVCASEGYSLFMRESFLGLVWLDGEKVSGPGAELYTLTEQTSRDETGSDEVKGMVSGHDPLSDPLAQFSLSDEKEVDMVTGLLLECSETSDRVQKHITALRKELGQN